MAALEGDGKSAQATWQSLRSGCLWDFPDREEISSLLRPSSLAVFEDDTALEAAVDRCAVVPSVVTDE